MLWRAGRIRAPRSSPPPSRHQSTRLWAQERALKRLQRVLTTFNGRGVRFGRRRPGRGYIPPSIPRSGLRTNWAGPFGAPALYNASIMGRVALGQHQPSRSAAFALPHPKALRTPPVGAVGPDFGWITTDRMGIPFRDTCPNRSASTRTLTKRRGYRVLGSSGFSTPPVLSPDGPPTRGSGRA